MKTDNKLFSKIHNLFSSSKSENKTQLLPSNLENNLAIFGERHWW